MKRKNPLHWDLRSLPEEMFNDRTLSRYKKDKDARNTLKRGAVIGTVGHLPRKGSEDKWLPTVEIAIVPPHALHPYGYKISRMLRSDLLTNVKLQNLIRSLAEVKHKDSIVFIPADTLYSLENRELFTPFMMLHDLGETLFSRPEYAKYRNEISKLLLEQQIHINVRGNNFIKGRHLIPKIHAYIPRLIHVQPQLDLREEGGRGYQATGALTFLDFMGTTVDFNSDYVCDLWALWCKREELTPSNFWPVKDVIEFFAQHVALSNKIEIVRNPIPIEDFCSKLNDVFSQLLDFIKGTIIVE